MTVKRFKEIRQTIEAAPFNPETVIHNNSYARFAVKLTWRELDELVTYAQQHGYIASIDGDIVPLLRTGRETTT